jgi:8-oxo-dGTP pyrophosphatase MutT (NUDIX family)
MHRKPILNLLADYLRRYPDETGMVARVEELVAAHADCFERTCDPGHITGSAWIVSADGERALLVHHRKLNKWLQPGGHADGQTDVAEVALREAREETGLNDLQLADATPLDVDVHVIPARGADPAHEHHDIRFLFVAPEGATPIVSDESHAVRWFTGAELFAATQEESVLRLWRKARLK